MNTCELCHSVEKSKETIETHGDMCDCEVCNKIICEDCSVYRNGFEVCKVCYNAEVGKVKCEDCGRVATREEIDSDEDCPNCNGIFTITLN